MTYFALDHRMGADGPVRLSLLVTFDAKARPLVYRLGSREFRYRISTEMTVLIKRWINQKGPGNQRSDKKQA